MSEIEAKRKLMEQAQLLITTNDAATTFSAFANVLDALGTLMSGWTGEAVRVQVTVIGQPDMVDMVKLPSTAGAPH